MTPEELLSERHSMVVCLGPGGVGKTTISAALGVRAAIGGRAVDVLTIDPAPRLIDVLGIAGDASTPRPVAINGARMRAQHLDPRAAFDNVVAKHAASPAAARAIISNRIYRNLSNALSGVAEYMAMEKLIELADDPENDLIVVDTPPAAHAIDFLDAPRRILEILNSRAITLLGAGMMPLRFADLAARAVLAAFDRASGLNLLGDVREFVERFDGMYAGFAERAQRAHRILRERATAVVMVIAPESARVREAGEFAREVEAAGIRVSAVIVNRVMAPLPDVEEIARAEISPALRLKLARNFANYAALKRREERALRSLAAQMPAHAAIIAAPDLGREPRSIDDLDAIALSLSR